MSVLKPYMGKAIQLELSGKILLEGILTDLGNDIVVIFDRRSYIYIPFVHVQNVKLVEQYDEITGNLPDVPIDPASDEISYRKILMNAKGMFVELRITPHQSLHGYLTSIMNDYFVFYSPVFGTVYVSLNHMKYLIPYQPNSVPYDLNPGHFAVKPNSMPLSRSFDQLIKKFEGHFTVFDLGEIPEKIGLLRSMRHNMIELVNADGNCFYWNAEHIKTVHLPG